MPIGGPGWPGWGANAIGAVGLGGSAEVPGTAWLAALSCGGSGSRRLAGPAPAPAKTWSWSGRGAPRRLATASCADAPSSLRASGAPFGSLKTSPKGSGPSNAVLFSIFSRSARVRPGFIRSPVASPNISVPTPTPFVIHAGLLSRCAPWCRSKGGPGATSFTVTLSFSPRLAPRSPRSPRSRSAPRSRSPPRSPPSRPLRDRERRRDRDLRRREPDLERLRRGDRRRLEGERRRLERDFDRRRDRDLERRLERRDLDRCEPDRLGCSTA
mmetsp:Transcript_25759/g.56839  ORF Transcript_25759/g.56839 Transcript_25759/m.56839 type:complete len:270 (-) Transcript_25759:679-1488(-)